MTTKSKAVVIAAKVDANILIAREAGKAALVARTMRDLVNDACKALNEAKVTIGQARTCVYAQAFLAERFKGKSASKASMAQILSAFRKAVETGEDYTENASKVKAAAKKKAAKAITKNDAPKAVDAAKPVEVKVVTKPAKDDDNSIVLSLPRKATAKQAAKQMREFIEKMRQSDSLADLASYLTDAIAEFDGTAEQF
jgi:hypothetical protein